jgi:hypothetical protein
MNIIEVVSIVGRIVAIGVTLVILVWFTSRRVASRPCDTPDPIRQHLERTGGPS